MEQDILKKIKIHDVTLYDYWVAPSNLGQMRFDWTDKPHRLIYDLVKVIYEYNKNKV